MNQLSKDKVELIKRTVCRGASDDELELFIHVCQRCGLDPFMKQIYSVKRAGVMTIQTSIDGLRLIADRSGNYSPGSEPNYVYTEEGKLLSATAHLKKRTNDGHWHNVSATAFFNEYKPNGASPFWTNMPHVMLAKCAEALALRKAFPAEMSGLYTSEEMDQSKVDVTEYLSEEQQETIRQLAAPQRLENLMKTKEISNLGEIPASEFEYICSVLHREPRSKAS